MDYSLKQFTNSLRERMYLAFPNLPYRGKNPSGSFKHGTHNQEIRDVAFRDNETMYVNDNMYIFEIGNEVSEKFYPYYHILEDSPVIRKRDRADKYTKGSQDSVNNKAKRDYAKISFNGKSFTKEYQKNIRGARKSVVDNSQQIINGYYFNRESDNYKNEHYHYIEKMMDYINPMIANDFGLTFKSAKSSGLGEDYVMGGNDTLEFLQEIQGE